MRRLVMVLFLVFTLPFAFTACGGGDDGAGKSGLGESCTKTDDCKSGLKCVDQVCVQDEDASDGDDSRTDGDSTNVVGLVWQDPPAGDSMEWQDAIDYCDDLSLDGHSDWRLPSISELRSLIRGCPDTVTGGTCGVTDSCTDSSCWSQSNCWSCSGDAGPADGCYWPDEMEGPCRWYWSSSPVEDDGYEAWVVSFDSGHVNYYGVDNGYYRVRCVR